jgi:hypothetical protein
MDYPIREYIQMDGNPLGGGSGGFPGGSNRGGSPNPGPGSNNNLTSLGAVEDSNQHSRNRMSSDNHRIYWGPLRQIENDISFSEKRVGVLYTSIDYEFAHKFLNIGNGVKKHLGVLNNEEVGKLQLEGFGYIQYNYNYKVTLQNNTSYVEFQRGSQPAIHLKAF